MAQWSVDSETAALLTKLKQSTGGRPRLLSRRVEPALFGEIAARGQPGAIIALLPHALSRAQDCAAAAAAAVDHLIQPLIPKHVLALDEWLRINTRYDWYGADVWSKLKPPSLTRILRLPDHLTPTLLALASCHHNGHVRQAAVQHLARTDTDIAIPFLLLRVNDWVEEVRTAALAAVSNYLEPANAARLIPCLLLVERLETVTRVDHTQLLSSIKSLLTSLPARAALRTAARSGVVRARRYASHLLLDAPDEEPLRVLTGAVADPDPTLALWALQEAPNSLGAVPLSELLHHALEARPPRVRVQALRLVETYFPEQALQMHRACLADAAASVRTQAQWLVRARTPDDLGAYYRELLRETPVRPAALLGLAEAGAAAYASIIEAYVSHDSARVRTAAVFALGQLSAAQYAAAFVRALQDGSSKVSRAAAAVLRVIGQPSADELWSILSSTGTRHVQRRALGLIADRGKWTALLFLLRAIGDADSFLDEHARQHLHRWLIRANSDFTIPSADELELLRKVFVERSRYLDSGMREELGFVLRTSE